MQDVSKGEGRTVLFVSHNMGSMQQLCTKGILLDNGCISFSGNICETVNVYQSGIVLQKNLWKAKGFLKYCSYCMLL